MPPALEPLEPHRSHPLLWGQLFQLVAHFGPPSPSGCQSCVSGEGEWGARDASPALPAPPHLRQGIQPPSPPPTHSLSCAPPPPGSQGALGTPLPHRRLAATELSRARPPRAAHTLALAAPLVSCSTIEEDNDSGGFDALDLDGRCPVGPGGFTGALRIVGPQETRVQWIHREPCAGARRPGLRP